MFWSRRRRACRSRPVWGRKWRRRRPLWRPGSALPRCLGSPATFVSDRGVDRPARRRRPPLSSRPAQPHGQVDVDGGVQVARGQRRRFRIVVRDHFRRPVVSAPWRGEHRQGTHPVRIGEREVQGDAAAPRRADEPDTFVSKVVQETAQILDLAERTGRRCRLAEAAQVVPETVTPVSAISVGFPPAASRSATPAPTGACTQAPRPTPQGRTLTCVDAP